MPRNPYLRTLKVDCKRLDDSAIDSLLRPSLHELCLHNCSDFSGRLLSEVGARCKGLRSLLPLSMHRFLCDLREFFPSQDLWKLLDVVNYEFGIVLCLTCLVYSVPSDIVISFVYLLFLQVSVLEFCGRKKRAIDPCV